MKVVQNPWKPLIGQLVWSVRRGVGTSLTMEFGNPHLSIREPISIAQGSDRVRSDLARRRVFIVGDWHLWIQYGNWAVHMPNASLNSNDKVGTALDKSLELLDGQRLQSADSIVGSATLILRFDGEAAVTVSPAEDIQDTLWSLHLWSGDIVTCDFDGSLTMEKATTEKG